MREYRLRQMTPEERTAKHQRDNRLAEDRRSEWEIQRDRNTRRKFPCAVCGQAFKRKPGYESGRIAKYCSTQCRSRRSREISGVAPGAVAEYLRFTLLPPGQPVSALKFYETYVTWAGIYGVDPLSPSDMLPQLKARGFRIEGDDADQVVILSE
ncbi:hypothetical protein [Streptomyces sp. S.PNR 29]|uniref:hypothetical protein n=1 Tax=Streptomyces sp. S.PNR 29 TaxID=2973805 RepID=UPI0025B088D6|nr:hypothetical protein [Streptomyces sp. S.PNR 29]MDN0198097.1 hypothetical protein [Streptomyces sp. S.PNR 29]